MKTTNTFTLTQVLIQMPNEFQPAQWGAPVLIAGVHVVTGPDGAPVHPPAHIQRPMASDEFTPERIEQINTQLASLGIQITPLATD